MLAPSLWLEGKETRDKVLAAEAVGGCEHRGQAVSLSGEYVGSERRGGKGRETGQTDRHCPELTQHAVDRWMDGQTVEEFMRARVTEKVGATADDTSERHGSPARTQDTLEGTERVREKSTSPRKRKGAKGRSAGMSMHARAHTRSGNDTQTAYSIGLLWREGRSMAG